MNKHNFFLIFFLFLLIIPISFSATPIIQGSNYNNGLQISFMKNEAFMKDSSPTFNVHVYNSSNALLTNQANCTLFIYDNNNVPILNASMTNSGFEQSYTINSTFTANLGNYPYELYCFSTQGEYGFISGSYYITSTGRKAENEGFNWLALVVAFAFMSFMFFYVSKTIVDEGLKASKILFFLLAVMNTFMIALIIYLITINGFDIVAFSVYSLAYAIISVFLLVGFVFNYALVKLGRLLHKGLTPNRLKGDKK